MGAALEALPARQQGFRSSALRKPLSLWARDCRLVVDPEGSVRSMDSYSEGRALFGFERPWLYKVQAGVVVQAQRADWSVRASSKALQFSGRLFDSLDVVQSVHFLQGPTVGYARTVKVRNSGPAGVKLRVVGLFDPAAAQLVETPGRWGSIGLNAFNRDSHVAMDEVADPPSARVIGAIAQPARFYMTTDRSRALDLVASGELPEATAGMSGQVMVLSVHDLDLLVGEAKELTFVCIYNRARLEDALSDFRGIQKGAGSSGPAGPTFACSDRSVADAAAWALTALEGSGRSSDALDRAECATAAALSFPATAKAFLERGKEALRRDGSAPHSTDPLRQGVLESAVMLQGIARYLVLAQDRKLSRSAYPTVRKLALFLMSASKDCVVRNDPSLPQGWRRRIGRGYPTGEIPEVTLAVSAALAEASRVSGLASRSEDAGRFRERSEMLQEEVRKRLLDDRGLLALCVDTAGRTRAEETVDMAVAAYRCSFHQPSEQAVAHRLMEADFETAYGPRCVPKSNQVYFSRSYGNGQLGGYWTRAALAYAVLCYRLGLSGIGSLTVQRVSRLVVEDAAKLKGSPGEFPQWVDPEGQEAHGDDTDRVAAARLIEGLLFGEGGLGLSSGGATFSPPASSSLSWIMAADFWAGESMTLFVGRSPDGVHAFLAGPRASGKGVARFGKAEVLEQPAAGVSAVSFYDPGQVVCVGNGSSSQVAAKVVFPPRARDLSKKLTTALEAYDAGGSWAKVGSVKVLPSMSFDASLRPGEWKAFRVSA